MERGRGPKPLREASSDMAISQSLCLGSHRVVCLWEPLLGLEVKAEAIIVPD